MKGTNINSTLRWWYTDDYGRCIRNVEWRAGSGMNTNPCDNQDGGDGHGWLPNGWYDLRGHWNNYNQTIKGRVWWLQNMQCHDGTWRTELFIHTEETAGTRPNDQGQACGEQLPDDDLPYCWDKQPAYAGAANGTYDYYSNGCIKVRRKSPEGNWANDMLNVHKTWHDLGGGSSHGSFTRTDTVYVHA